MIGIVDFGGGNLFSLDRALERLGHKRRIISRPDEVDDVSQMIVPGVGAYGEAMRQLTDLKFDTAIKTFAASGRPLIGICLGMQLLVDGSKEFGCHQGLGLIPGEVRKIPAKSGPGSVRIPNIGWRLITPSDDKSGFPGLSTHETFGYFVHSYCVEVGDPRDLKAWTAVNDVRVAAIIGRNNVLGFQFHPEKSGERGIDLLSTALGA